MPRIMVGVLSYADEFRNGLMLRRCVRNCQTHAKPTRNSARPGGTGAPVLAKDARNGAPTSSCLGTRDVRHPAARPGRSSQPRSALLEDDLPEQSRQIVVRTGGKEERVLVAIRAEAITEVDRPKLVNVDYIAIGVLNGTHELPVDGVEGVDGASISIIRDQQRIAKRTEIAWRCGESPGLIQRPATGKSLHERSILLEDVYEPSRSS